MLLPSPTQAIRLPPQCFAHREQVGEHLAGVGEIGQAVDHGDGGVARQLFHLSVVERANHDPVDVA
jgi:hypothetical protein